MLRGYDMITKKEKQKQELKADIKHLRAAARTSCDSYIGRMTRQTLNRQADEKEQELKKLKGD